MPVYSLNDLTGWKHLPLDAVVFFYTWADDVNSKVTLRNFLEGSTWSWSGIYSKAKDKSGNPKQIGIKFEGKLTVLENDIHSNRAMLTYMMGNNPVDMFIQLQGNRANASEAKIRFNAFNSFANISTNVIVDSDNGTNSKITIEFSARVNLAQINFLPSYTL